MRRIIVVALFTLVTIPAVSAGETLPTSGAPPFLAARAGVAPSQTEAVVRLAELFRTNSTVVVSANGMQMTEPPASDVLLARIAADGTLATVCVSTAEAAARFLDPERTPQPARPLQR